MSAVKRLLTDVHQVDYTEGPCPWCCGVGSVPTDNGPFALEERCGNCRGTGTVITEQTVRAAPEAA